MELPKPNESVEMIVFDTKKKVSFLEFLEMKVNSLFTEDNFNVLFETFISLNNEIGKGMIDGLDENIYSIVKQLFSVTMDSINNINNESIDEEAKHKKIYNVLKYLLKDLNMLNSIKNAFINFSKQSNEQVGISNFLQSFINKILSLGCVMSNSNGTTCYCGNLNSFTNVIGDSVDITDFCVSHGYDHMQWIAQKYNFLYDLFRQDQLDYSKKDFLQEFLGIGEEELAKYFDHQQDMNEFLTQKFVDESFEYYRDDYIKSNYGEQYTYDLLTEEQKHNADVAATSKVFKGSVLPVYSLSFYPSSFENENNTPIRRNDFIYGCLAKKGCLSEVIEQVKEQQDGVDEFKEFGELDVYTISKTVTSDGQETTQRVKNENPVEYKDFIQNQTQNEVECASDVLNGSRKASDNMVLTLNTNGTNVQNSIPSGPPISNPNSYPS